MATTITTSQTASTLPQKKGDPPNFGTVKSGRALAFDGVVDYLTTGVTFSETSHTIALWVYMNNSGTDNNIIDIRDANDDGILIQQLSDEKVRYHINDDILTTTSAYTTNWVRIVCTYDGTTQKLYANGNLDASGAITETVATTANIFIGARSFTSRTNFFDGNLSDVQFWDTAWSLTDVTNDYTHPEMLAHTLSGTSLTESNLKVWYPMTEGNPESPQTTIFDGSPKVLGDNPTAFSSLDFTSGDWTNLGGITSSTANTITTAAYGGKYAATSNTRSVIDKVYKCTLDATTTSSGGFQIRNAGNTDIYLAHASTSNYSGSFYFTASHVEFYIRNEASGTLTINSISVQEVRRGNHATSVFYGEELINATLDFSNSTGWNVTASAWSIGSNTASYDDSASQLMYTSNALTSAIVAGKTYRLTVVISGLSSGTARIALTKNDGTAIYAYDNYANGTHDIDFAALVDSTEFGIYAHTDSTGAFDIESVTLKEVGLSTTGHVEGQETIFQPAFVGQNRMIAFDGVDDTLTVSEFTFVPSQSINMWINIDNLDTYRSLFGLAASDNYMRFGADAGNADNEFYFEDDYQDAYEIEVGANTIKPNEWIMLTFVWNADRTMDAYMNSSLRGSSSATIDPSVSGNVENSRMRITKFGGGYSNTWFNGIMTEISYYNDVLTLAEIQDLYNDGQAKSALEASGSGGLVHYWRNNVLTATGTWEDLKGSNDGTLTGGSTVIFPEGTTSGRDINGFFLTHPNKNYLSLDGTDGSYVNVPHSDVFDFGTGSFTVQFWIKPHTLTNNDRIITKGTTDAGEWMISVNTDGSSNKVVRVYTKDSDSNVVDTGSETTKTLTINTWSFITVVFDRPNEDILVYKDDSLTEYNKDASTWDATKTFDNTEPITIGASDTLATGTFFDGIIDDVRIYNKVLSESDITKNYRHGSGKHKD